jgi:hypothetical protein
LTAMPFDPNDPPARPPARCSNPLMWAMAYRLHQDHRSDSDGFCVSCVPGQFSPCIGRYLAMRGFLASCDLSNVVPSGEWS